MIATLGADPEQVEIRSKGGGRGGRGSYVVVMLEIRSVAIGRKARDYFRFVSNKILEL